MADAITYLALAKKAGALCVGVDAIRASTEKAKLIVLSSDASENTKKKARNLASFHNIPCVGLTHTTEELGAALGRGLCAFAAVTNVHLAKAVREYARTE